MSSMKELLKDNVIERKLTYIKKGKTFQVQRVLG